MATHAGRSDNWGINRLRRIVVRIAGVVSLCLIAACSSLNATQSAALSSPVVQPKILATVFVSPTADDQQREHDRHPGNAGEERNALAHRLGRHACIPRRTILASVSWSRPSSPAILPPRIT